LFDVLYIQKRKKFRSRVEVAVQLGVLPYFRSTKAMPRYMLAKLAVETREIFLISHHIQSHQSPQSISSFVIQDDEIRVIVPKEEEETRAQEHYFAFGNTVILNWGEIIPNGHFHNKNWIYPLGFKCIRQEHDKFMHRVVDCICEVDAILPSSPNSAISVDNLSPQIKADLRPLFRITVAWALEDKQCVRVYEGLTCQAVWQAILLETVSDVTPNDIRLSSTGTGVSAEVPDEGELSLRRQIMSLRQESILLLCEAQVRSVIRPSPPSHYTIPIGRELLTTSETSYEYSPYGRHI
jgi:hypothetical protein